MDAFIGESRTGKNIGLLNQMWLRLYGSHMPKGLVTGVECHLQKESYPRDNFFDLRMGIRLDEDRWAAEANANYKMETLFRNSVFDFSMSVSESVLREGENAARLYYVLQELVEGRFWFGAGKSKGLGRFRLEIDLPFSPSGTLPSVCPAASHLVVDLTFDATNPVLVGWNWGKVDPVVPSFAAVEGRVLVEAMRDLPEPVRERLAMSLGGPILSPQDWKDKFAQYLPRVIAIWLQERSAVEVEVWVLPVSAVNKLGKGRYKISKKVLATVQPLVGQPFSSKAAAETALNEALGEKANMTKRFLKIMVRERQTTQQFNNEIWRELAGSLELDVALEDRLAEHIRDESALIEILSKTCQKVLTRLYQQVDQQIDLLQSDSWVDAEIATRGQHLRIKTMLRQGKITEQQWADRDQAPEGISVAVWRTFLDDHRRVQFRHMLNTRNLSKSITNDRNFIAFLQAYRERTRQELAQPHHIDFRAGGAFNRTISRKYGKPYDTVFMRMLSWGPSTQESGAWEIYIPGSTIKGAFRKRAAQVLRTLWGESARTTETLGRLFGAQRRRGLVFFSDAYLVDPLDPERSWCSMDGVRMDPKTGRPIENAKFDSLFAYGEKLVFGLRLDIQDVREQDVEAISVLFHLIQDFQRGDIPLGGSKTSGFGWVKADVARLTWLTADPDGVSKMLFGDRELEPEGLWQKLALEGEAAASALQAASRVISAHAQTAPDVPKAGAGFVSHRAFGGYCGTLAVEAKVLTPIHVRESGEPSFRATLSEGPVNGWDFFSMAPPETSMRGASRCYALPSKSIKGMLRHLYTIVSDSKEPSLDVSRLSPVDSLFGWVGEGPNQAIMGRLVFGFGTFDAPELGWFKVPYPYGEWEYTGDQWRKSTGNSVQMHIVGKNWRMFTHAPLAPIVKGLDDFHPDTFQASYFRAILPAARARFTVRFWNLDEQELSRLIWCIVLEPQLAHKMGKGRYLGFGSLRLKALPDSFIIDWAERYAGKPEERWQLPIDVEKWIKPGAVYHYRALRKVLNADQL